jgi:hypothetical protein
VTGNVYVALSNPGAQRFGDILDHTNSARPGEGNAVYVAYGQFTGFAAPVRTS